MRRLGRLLGLVALVALCVGCEASMNTSAGAFAIRPGSLYRKASTTKTTGPTATTPETSESTCEGGVCVPPAPK